MRLEEAIANSGFGSEQSIVARAARRGTLVDSLIDADTNVSAKPRQSLFVVGETYFITGNFFAGNIPRYMQRYTGPIGK